MPIIATAYTYERGINYTQRQLLVQKECKAAIMLHNSLNLESKDQKWIELYASRATEHKTWTTNSVSFAIIISSEHHLQHSTIFSRSVQSNA